MVCQPPFLYSIYTEVRSTLVSRSPVSAPLCVRFFLSFFFSSFFFFISVREHSIFFIFEHSEGHSGAWMEMPTRWYTLDTGRGGMERSEWP